MDGSLVTDVHQLYARQSHLIDSGQADAWARTFAPDGEFHSPTYPEPVVGQERLRAFAERFTENSRAGDEVHRHVVTNVFVEPVSAESTEVTEVTEVTELQVSAYLQVIATRVTGDTRILRFTTVHDRLTRHGKQWRITRREVRRDDAPA